MFIRDDMIKLEIANLRPVADWIRDEVGLRQMYPINQIMF